MENLILSINVVLPILFILGLGYFIKYIKMIDESTLDTLNNITFKIFIPILLFNNVYKTELKDVFNPNLMSFSVVTVFILFLCLCLLVPILEKDDAKRGVLIQGMFRSNFVVFGIPVTATICGNGAIGITSLLTAIIVPMFNVLSVIILEIYKGGKVNAKKILKGIATNPLIIASALGILCVVFKLSFPYPIEKTVADIAKMATPLSLLILGGSFKFAHTKHILKQVVIRTLGRLIIVPFVFIGLGIFSGFRGVELASIMVLFASPASSSSFTMAKQMGADGELAGQLVVFSSIFCILTVFLWTFLLKETQLI